MALGVQVRLVQPALHAELSASGLLAAKWNWAGLNVHPCTLPDRYLSQMP